MSTILAIASIVAVFLLAALSIAGFIGAREQRRGMPWVDEAQAKPVIRRKIESD